MNWRKEKTLYNSSNNLPPTPSSSRSEGDSKYIKKRRKKNESFWCLSLPTIDSMQGFEEIPDRGRNGNNGNISKITIEDYYIDDSISSSINNGDNKIGNFFSFESPNHSRSMIPPENYNTSTTVNDDNIMVKRKKNELIYEKKKRWFSTGNLFHLKNTNEPLLNERTISSPRMMLKNVKKVFSLSRKSKDKKDGSFINALNCLSTPNENNHSKIVKYHALLDTIQPIVKKNEVAVLDSNNETKCEQEVSTFIGDDEEIYITFRLNISLHSGINLAKRDACGSSDPYIKFKYKSKIIYKSCVMYKNLNPNWEEEFSFLIEDPTEDLYIDCYDYDRFMTDDYMGGCIVNLAYLTLTQNYDLKLELEDKNNPNEGEELGFVRLSIMIEPLTKKERDAFLMKAVRGVVTKNRATNKMSKNQQIWYAVLNVVLVQANLNMLTLATSSSRPSPYVKFRLGNEKYKSKVIQQTFEPQWLEQFDLHIYDEETHDLELSVIDKSTNSVLGNSSLKMSDIIKEQTNEMWIDLYDDKGSILLLLSISGSSVTTGSIDRNDCEEDERNEKMKQYSLKKTFDNIYDVGHLSVKVYKASNLAALDLNGKSDPFVVVELDNARLQTHTEYKTLNPEWNKMFTFNVKDIHSILYFTLYDEDPNKKTEFLGKVAIPLLSIKNASKKWYGLKDFDLKHRVKGEIYIELEVIWNPIRAALRTFNPKERKLIERQIKFQKSKLIKDVNILKNYYKTICEYSDEITGIFNWENYIKSFLAMIGFILIVYYFEPFHLPLVLLFIFMRNYLLLKVRRNHGLYGSLYNASNYSINLYNRQESPDPENFNNNEVQEKSTTPNGSVKKENVVTTWKNTVFSLGDHLILVQEAIHYIVSLMERIMNTFNFSVPYLSLLGTVSLLVISIILYFIPIRWIIMIWGINKFTKKLRNPHFIPNNELLDFLSRVPSNSEKDMYSEFMINSQTIDGKK